MDPYKFLRITLNPDGSSLTRSQILPTVSPSANHEDPVHSFDLPLDPNLKTSIRLFVPNPKSNPKNLPIILYFHGGGFICFSSSTAPFHASCASLAARTPALVLSVDYRLAPESRLPAAYDDAVAALHWLRSNAVSGHPLLRDADVSRCFLMGSSSGGNIVFHAAVRSGDLAPVRIAGLIFDQAYFGGSETTESERRLEGDKMVPLAANHLMWELALPLGADRDHEYCNLGRWEGRVRGLPASLVRGFGGDPLVDRQRELAGLLRGEGVKVVERICEDGFHGVELFDPSKEEERLDEIADFVRGEVARERL